MGKLKQVKTKIGEDKEEENEIRRKPSIGKQNKGGNNKGKTK